MTAYYLSFDVEDWFHSHNLWPALDRDQWDEYELRVVENTRRILDLLDKHEVKATFFVLGHVAERAPEVAPEIESRGHEVASHGFNHRLLHEQSIEEIRADLSRSKELLESQVAQSVLGYRAPSFSITEEAADALAEIGYKYDSSQYPVAIHDRYGRIEVRDNRTFTEASDGLIEAQLPLLDLPGVHIPWAGGAYFRAIPYRVFSLGVERISRARDFVFYLHPWEIDPGQPRVRDVGLQYRLRHYYNIEKTERRLESLLASFDWQPISKGIQ